MTDSTPLIYGKYTAQKDGKSLDIRIQQVTPELYEPVIDHMTKYFLPREVTCHHLDLPSETQSVHDIQQIWRELIKDGAAVVAIVENDPNPPSYNIIGANAMGISRKGEKSSYELKGNKLKKVMEVIDSFTNEGNVYKTYGVDKYLTALGLSVHPNYHGIGLGLKLLQARKEICKSFGLKMTVTVFTSRTSQYLARKAGFHVISEVDYKTYEVNGKIHFPKLDEQMSLMALVYE